MISVTIEIEEVKPNDLRLRIHAPAQARCTPLEHEFADVFMAQLRPGIQNAATATQGEVQPEMPLALPPGN
jgi:hypothetical protein